MYILYLIFVFYFLIYQATNIFCSWNRTQIYSHLGTKTPYRIIANKNDSPIVFEGCEPAKIWMVIRHGTRYPSRKFIYQLNEKLPAIQSKILNNLSSSVKLSTSDLQKIRTWNVFVNEDNEKKLAHEGEEEMIALAERMQSRFPTLLSNIYSNSSYKFRYTATQRTEESARNFAVGLFGSKTSNSVWYPEALKKDPILRFYKLCNKWRKNVKKNPEALRERKSFEKNSHVQSVLEEISTKLGFETVLTFHIMVRAISSASQVFRELRNFVKCFYQNELGNYLCIIWRLGSPAIVLGDLHRIEQADSYDIYLMYMTCAFETSWFKENPSPWCIPFSNQTIKVLEYAEDLKYYWIDGYGYQLTYAQACPAIINMVDFFKRKDDYPKAVLYFTHSGTMLKLLAHLGLYKDVESLRHDNFVELEDRHWRVSKIDTFGANIATVLYRCGNTDKILLLHQERIVKIPGCSETELCDFNTFLDTYQNSIYNCNFDEMCTHR